MPLHVPKRARIGGIGGRGGVFRVWLSRKGEGGRHYAEL
jgi:hypothetical protein